MKRISANAVKFKFWYTEFVQAMGMANDNDDFTVLRQQILAENTFHVYSHARLITTTGGVLRRMGALTPAMRLLFD